MNSRLSQIMDPIPLRIGLIGVSLTEKGQDTILLAINMEILSTKYFL